MMSEIAPPNAAGQSSEKTCSENSKERYRLPGPRGAPFAWAESRQELCETLPYYRAFHSGCYKSSAKVTSQSSKRKKTKKEKISRDSIPYGYLLAGFGASQDAWQQEGRVIISHGGGKSGVEESASKKDSNDFTTTETSINKRVHAIGDQTMEDGQVSSLVHSHRCQTPIVLLIAKDYKLSHFELSCAFAVLGWYWITDVWCEKEPGKDGALGWVRWKFRFQYIQSQGHPWWLGDEQVPFWNPKEDQEHDCAMAKYSIKKSLEIQDRSAKCLSKSKQLIRATITEQYASRDYICIRCQQTSPLIFENGWMCLSQDCSAFWKLRDATTIEKGLQFSFAFMELRAEPSHFALGGLPFSLHPPQPLHSTRDQGDSMRGLHCMCGRLTCRRYDYYRHCAHCGIIRPCRVERQLQKSPLIHSYTGLESCKVHHASGIRAILKELPSDNLVVTSFYFPETLGGGEVHLIESIGGEQEEADCIFEAMQQGPSWSESANSTLIPHYSKEVIPFRRHPMSCHTVKGDLLSQQFTCNYGAEYKHSVKMGTVYLDKAPKCITSALDLIKKRTRKVIPSNNVEDDDFNEVYPVKYRGSQKMNFHDDGEPGLGPTISSLSLGREAKMLFRLKEKYVDTAGYSNEALELAESSYDGVKDKAEKGKITMANRILLSLTLRHGCIVIQHGRKLQELIEHAVQPQMGVKQRGDNGLRIAVTARRIDKVSSREVVQR